MSSETPSMDPYLPPPALPPMTANKPLPAALKAICIIAMVLGLLGTILSCMGVVGLAVNQSFAGGFGFPAGGGGDAATQAAQKELQDGMTEITRQYLPYSYVVVILHLAAGLLLTIGGLLGLKSSPAGRSTLLAGFFAAIVYEIGQTILNLIIQTKTLPLVQKSMDQMLQRPGQPNLPQGVGQLMVVVMFVILGITLITVLVKVAFYAYSIYYLNRKDIVARFSV